MKKEKWVLFEKELVKLFSEGENIELEYDEDHEGAYYSDKNSGVIVAECLENE